MKTNVILLMSLIFFSGLSLRAQQKEDFKNYIWTYEGKNRTHTLGLYGGLYGSYSPVKDQSAGYLGIRVAAVLDGKWGLGLAGYALDFDHPMNELTGDETYRLQAGYSGIFGEYLIPIGQRLKISFSLLSGMGLVKYQVDKEYELDLPWHERIIDQNTFAVLEPGMEIQARISRKWWMGINATYRTTSPIRMKGTDENLLENYSAGISIKYGLF